MPLRLFFARFWLRNGHRDELTLIAPDTCAACLQLHDYFGERLRAASVRPA